MQKEFIVNTITLHYNMVIAINNDLKLVIKVSYVHHKLSIPEKKNRLYNYRPASDFIFNRSQER